MTSPTQTAPPRTATDVRVDRMTESEWDGLLDRFADANLYQTWAYGAVSWGEKQLSHLVLRQNGTPVAVAQLRLVRIPIVGRGVAYLRWGPVCVPTGESWDAGRYRAMAEAIVGEYVRRRRLLLRILPGNLLQDSQGESVLGIWRDLGLRTDSEVRPYRTLRLDLTSPSEELRKRLDGKWRNQLNGAERNGLVVHEGTHRDLYDRFLRLYREMMARKNFETTVDPEEFARIQDRLPERRKFLVSISEKDGQPMTGLVASRVGDTGVYLLGATSDAGMKSKGSYLLQWRMIERLKELGCRWYDLGGIDPDKNPGVYHFKQGMGGEEANHPGRLSLSGGPLSDLCVASAERLQRLAKTLRPARRNAGNES